MANTFKFGNGKWYGKKGTIMAYNDENKNYKPLAFDFTRTSTATYVGSDGLIKTAGDGEPRVDYLDNTDGHLLLEPSRSNKSIYSEDFSQFTAVEATLDKSFTAPDGTSNATKLTDNSVDSTHRIIKTCTTSSSGAATYSVFLKKGTMTDAVLNLFSGSTIGRATVDLENGTITLNNGTSANIEEYDNDWYRCSVTGNLASTSTTIYVYMSDSTSSYVGSGEDLFVWGAQLEEGSYATSYIPTEGASVTRTADAASSSVNTDVINSTEGTIYFEGNSLESSFIYNYFITLSDNSQNNRLEIRQSSDDIQFLWRVGGTYQSAITKSNITTDTFKVAVKYSSANIKMYYNGSLVNTISSPTLYSANTLNRVGLDRGIVQSADQLRGKVKNIRIYNTALTDAELKTLTT